MQIQKILNYISFWELNCYFDGLPDEVPKEIEHLVPSYKLIAMTILSNDSTLQKLGYIPKKSIYYSMLKRAELKKRGVIKEPFWPKLF